MLERPPTSSLLGQTHNPDLSRELNWLRLRWQEDSFVPSLPSSRDKNRSNLMVYLASGQGL